MENSSTYEENKMNDILKKKIENIAKELGGKADFCICSDPYSNCKKVVIEYDHELKEKSNA